MMRGALAKPPGPLAHAVLPPAGEARSRLQWADGKSIKNEVDLQVGAGQALPVPCRCGARDTLS